MDKTVKVRIAVAVDPTGSWNAVGFAQDWVKGEKSGKESMEFAVEPLNDGEARYWITTELPIPETVEIQGQVTKAQKEGM